MDTLPIIRGLSGPFSQRPLAAWAAAPPVAQRALVAACVTSAVLGVRVPLPASAGVGIALAGMFMAAAALVDLHERKLPNRLLAAALASAVVGVAATGDASLIGRGALGLLIGGGLLLLVRLTRGVGIGDVKMAAVVGATTAPVAVVAAPVAIAVAATVAAGYGLLAKRSRLPLGPSLWFGWATAVAAGIAGWLA
ncbi:MAG: prepilin peptidase [Ilumatobacteraceae bacterium]